MLTKLLAERGVLLADGATGTNLFDLGLVSGDAPELWLEQKPNHIRGLHRLFVSAGADIVLSNSFGANGRRLMLHGLEKRTRELNRIAAALAREVADAAGRCVVVAGSVGPTGDLFAPLGPLSEAQACEVFVEQIEGLKAGGADVIWIETMSAVEEMRAAAQAAGRVGMPYALTASFDTAGRTMMGLPPAGLVDFAGELAPGPVALGANCGVGAADLIMSILAMSGVAGAPPLIAKANAGVPVVGAGGVVYSGDVATMARYAGMAIDAGARIVGGCCGTTPAHLAAMRRAIDRHKPGPRPALEEVVAALGPLVAPARSADAPRRISRRRASGGET